jgi:hypothetical protein
MISDQQLSDYFLNWLFFLNKDVRRGKLDERTVWRWTPSAMDWPLKKPGSWVLHMRLW